MYIISLFHGINPSPFIDFFTLASPLAAQNESWGYSALTSDGKYLMNQNTGGKWLLYDISKSHLYLKEMASMTDKICKQI